MVAHHFVPECRVTSDDEASVSSDRESFDGKVINHVSDDGLNGKTFSGVIERRLRFLTSLH